MQPISDNRYFISKENEAHINFFSAVRKRKSWFFGPDVTSNFREGLEKKIAPGVRKSWAPPALRGEKLNYKSVTKEIFKPLLSRFLDSSGHQS